jgi:hypothetical protein
MVDGYHWQSEEGYRVCVSQVPNAPPVWLAWAPRREDRPRDIAELLGPGVATRELAYDLAERHHAQRQRKAQAC